MLHLLGARDSESVVRGERVRHVGESGGRVAEEGGEDDSVLERGEKISGEITPKMELDLPPWLERHQPLDLSN